jgi:hypothetical protein
VVAIVGIAISVALFLYVSFKGHSPETKSDAGLVYFVLNAMAIAVLINWTQVPANDALYLSWNTIAILVSSMIMAGDAAEDPGDGARCGVDGSPRRLDGPPARPAGAFADPDGRLVHALGQVCHSLADAHARGLVHRDITPANIYACRIGLEYDFVKVLDFGRVKFNDQRSMERRLMTGVSMTTGTPGFMAPEVILDGEIDQRADVYALGCVAYYLLTGQLVFEAGTPMKMFVQHLQTQPIPPSQRTEMTIPREVDELVLACLEKDPRKHPQDALTSSRGC